MGCYLFSGLCPFLCQQCTHPCLPWTTISVYTRLHTSTLYPLILPQVLWVQVTQSASCRSYGKYPLGIHSVLVPHPCCVTVNGLGVGYTNANTTRCLPVVWPKVGHVCDSGSAFQLEMHMRLICGFFLYRIFVS